MMLKPMENTRICACSCVLSFIYPSPLSGLKMDDKTTLTSLLPFSWLPFSSRRWMVQPASSSNIKEQQCLLMLPGQLKYVWWIFTEVVQNVSLSGPLGSCSSCLIHSSITSVWGWGRPPPNVFISPCTPSPLGILANEALSVITLKDSFGAKTLTGRSEPMLPC